MERLTGLREDTPPLLPAHATLRRVDSLRWRLPFFFGTLIVIMLGTFIWAMSREVEGALVHAGHERAQAGADQVARMLEGAFAARVTEEARIKTDTAIKSALRNPTAPALAAARKALLPSATPVLRRSELWDARGSLILEVTTVPHDTVPGLRAFPPGTAPTAARISEMRASGKWNYFDIVMEIHDDASKGGKLLGYVRGFGKLGSSAGDPIRRLLGDSAAVKIGSAAGVWTDVNIIVDAPPALEGSPEGGVYRSRDGRRWVAGAAQVKGLPWTVWVGFPRTMTVAPARPFMRQMVSLALLFVVGGVALALFLGVRLTKPLHVLVNAAEQIAAGDYTRRVTNGRHDEIGRLGVAFNTMTDRIENAYTALRKSHEQTHFALAAARIGIWEADLATGTMLCSASMRLLHRVPGGTLPERCDDFVKLLHKDDRASVCKVLAGVTPGNDEFDIQYRASGPGGSLHWIEGKGRLIRDRAGKPISVLGVSVDVTERTRLESQFRQAQKMDAIGQLAGGVAHDFNNLLTAIIGHGELLLMQIDDTTDSSVDVKGILKAADSAAKLTRQLLTFSRHQITQPEMINANAVIRDTEQLLSRLIGEQITLVIDLATDLDLVKVDAAQLQQVLMNLAVNARDAMPKGGMLSIASANADLDDEYAANNPTVIPGPHVVISVSDTGMGMDAATQARLFEPFFTTKALGKGTGLGLATVYGIVKQGGGHIYVYSEPGHGTTFKIYLRVAHAGAITAHKELPALSGMTSGGETILVVDDNNAVRTVAQTILERLGYHVLVAASGQEALGILERAQPRPHLILSDVILPGMTGPELCREVILRYPDIRVMFSSGYSPEAIAPQAEVQRGALFVEKPYNVNQLGTKVREALGSLVV